MPPPEPPLPKKIALVRSEARARGVEVLVLAPGMQKRRRNTSFYNVKAKTLAWRVEWVFKCEDGKRAMIGDPRVEESVSPNAALARHIIENQMLNGEVIRLDGALRMAPK